MKLLRRALTVLGLLLASPWAITGAAAQGSWPD